MVKNETKRYWTKRAKFYKNDIRGVLFKKPYPSFVNTLFHNWSVGQVQGVIKKNDHVLDIACGWGRVSKELLKVNKKISIRGVDISKPFAQIYNNELSPRAKAKVASMEKLPFKNNQFDLILCYETIEHVRNPKKVISEMRRVLKKKGKLILAMDSGTLTFRIIWFFWERTRGRVWQAAHLNPYHHRDLEALVLQSGFKITQKYFTHFGLEIVLMLEK